MFNIILASLFVMNPVVNASYKINEIQYNQIEFQEDNKVNLLKEKVNDIIVDIGYLASDAATNNELKNKINEAIVYELANKNGEKEWMDTFLSSYLFENPEQWKTVGIIYQVPEFGEVAYNKVRFVPILGNENFSGLLTVNVALSNGVSVLKKDLADDLVEIDIGDLGFIKNPSENLPDAILEKTYEKNPNLKITELVVSSIKGKHAYINVKKDSEYYNQGEEIVFFDYVNDERENLENYLKMEELGEIESLTENNIKLKIKEKNPMVDIDELVIKNITKTSATASVKENSLIYYPKTIDVKFTVKPDPINLNKFDGDLGKISGGKITDIQNALIKWNPSLDLTKVRIINIKYSGALLVSTDTSVYLGSLNLTFSYDIFVSTPYFGTAEAFVEVYNSRKTVTKKDNYSYNIEGSRSDFLWAYNYVEFEIDGYLARKTQSIEKDTKNISGKIKLPLSTVITKNIGTFKYDGTQNWNKSRADLSAVISGNTLRIDISAEVEAYATAWNAYWSKAWAQVSVKSIKFTKN